MRRTIPSGSPYELTVGFSRAVLIGTPAGAMVHVAGTAPVWPDGTVDPDPLVQARRCWEIALGALDEAGGDPSTVVRTRTFLADRAHEAVAAQVHGELFADIRPASTMLVVAGLLDPRWLLEVELDAYLDAQPDGRLADWEASPAQVADRHPLGGRGGGTPGGRGSAAP